MLDSLPRQAELGGALSERGEREFVSEAVGAPPDEAALVLPQRAMHPLLRRYANMLMIL